MRRKSKHWFTKEFKVLLKYKKKVWHYYKKEKSEEVYNRYKILKNSIKRKIVNAKQCYLSKLINSNNSSLFFKYIAKFTKSENTVPNILKYKNI